MAEQTCAGSPQSLGDTGLGDTFEAMKKAIIYTFMSLFLLAVSAAGAGLFIFYKYGADLPDYRQLATYRPPITTRVYAGDGRLLAEYAIEKRIFVPVSAFPKTVIDAFLAAEDKNFYEHIGGFFRLVHLAARGPS